jgi:small subunit ribosomal protein S10
MGGFFNCEEFQQFPVGEDLVADVFTFFVPFKLTVRFGLKAFDSTILNEACKTIIEVASDNCAKVIGPIGLPIKRRIYCVLRSPHVNKDARDHFEIRTHKRFIDFEYGSVEAFLGVLENFRRTELPAGIDLTIDFFYDAYNFIY